MKETIYTIPVNEAFQAEDECPFCYLERLVEQKTIRYTLGPEASYMEPDVRAATDQAGFCGTHYKKMYDYGNNLGNALIMQTYFVSLFEEMTAQMDSFKIPGKRSLFGKKQTDEESPLIQWARKKQSSCFICDKINYNMQRYYETFFTLCKDPEFRSRVENTKGFCMHHFLGLMEMAEQKVPNGQQEWFYTTVFRLMRENMARVKGDLDWFIAKFDYRNADADWKNSRDAVPRTMQKLQGIYPADPPFRSDPR